MARKELTKLQKQKLLEKLHWKPDKLTKWQVSKLNGNVGQQVLNSQWDIHSDLLPGHCKLLKAVLGDALQIISKGLHNPEFRKQDLFFRAYNWLTAGSKHSYPFSLGWICDCLSSLTNWNYNADTIAAMTKRAVKTGEWKKL